MKKILYLVVMTLMLSGCLKLNERIDRVDDKVNHLESRVDALEELCKQMNTNISSLQTLVKALQQNDYVTGVTPITKNGEIVGYTISFTKSEPITIYHGNNGEDGKNGSDGADGHTPQIGVKQDSDGIYYWTVDGDWLLDDSGNKVKAVGIDGKDGENGTDGKDGQDGSDGKDGQDGTNGADGITPQLKIENDYWYISYDNGDTWNQLGQATGDKGDTGLVGDSMFTDVDYDNGDYVIFTLSNGVQIKIPTWYAFEQLQTLCNQMNTNIASLQTIIGALQNNDYVQSITPLMENGKEVGYTITFTKSGAVTIYHGKDGKDGANGNDGQNGTNGVDGKDGHTPQIGVKQDTDGIYYWTVDGEWLLDDTGNKIKAVGTDGKDGQDGANGNDGQDGVDGTNGTNGTDGITPELKIENGYWYVSYDDGATWKQLGKATGEDGKDGTDGTDGTNGKDGDSFFQGVDTSNSDYVVITLADGTEIKLPTWYAFEQLQKLCNQMNTNIASLQTIIGALQNNDYVQSITPLMENGKEVGYTITFTKSGAVTIYHGKDGKDGANGNDGQNGTNGVDGKDGHTPQIGVKQDTDGIYYWTVDGEWLLDDTGNKIKAVGTDGKDGQDGTNGNDGQNGINGTDGTDGITPVLKIENGYWYVSYDEGATWKQLGNATGEDGQDGTNGTDGKDGQDGDSFFQGVDTSNSDYVILTLADGTEIKLPTWYAFEQLQKLCNQMNTNIASLQTIVGALQNNDYIQSITPLMENGKEVGYTITFAKSGAVTIYHGKDGANGANGNNGQNGTNGTNGVDGHTPQIGVKQDTDGIYYWTVDGEWLLDNDGNKVKAVGTDGKDGQDGANGNDGQSGTNGIDGITPELKIENGYWYVSYDEGATWKQLGKATGENGQDGINGTDGKDGQDGDSFFQGVDTSNSDYVILTLADGTEIKLPTWYAFEQLQKLCNQMNTNIASLQTIIGALQNNDYIQSITPLMENGKEVGYTITFTKSGAVTIYHGKDGANGANGNDGQNGTNGVDGKDGHTPQIGVKQDTDGIYYWTVDGEWLLDDNGNKIKAIGTDGKDGEDGANGNDGQNGTNGTDGITPELKIENGYWYVSYDDGITWKQLGKATGEDGQDGINGTDGKDGQDGDSFFQSVTEDEYNVYITLADGSVFTLPKTSSYLFNRLQSITFIPKYSDGKAAVMVGVVEFDFQISPKNAVEDIAANWQSILTMKAVYTITRAVSFIDMPILSCEADEANGVITITASGENLSGEFFAGTQEASATLMLSDGNNEITSGYIPLAAHYPKNNEIWYTSTSGKIVTPRETDAFGANIVSNTYENGKGVIKFDGDVAAIGESAFSSCNSLTTIAIPDSVTEIGHDAFYFCRSLTTITIPDSVSSIGESAFRDCSSLKAFYSKFASEDNRCLIIDSVLNSFAPADLTSYTIPDSVTKIGQFAFWNCQSLTTITIPDSVTKIGQYAFYHCFRLTSINIPVSVTRIESGAFDGCSSLTTITIPDSVTSIGSSTFRGCSSLKAFYGKFASEDNRCLIIDSVLISFAPADLTAYTIPNSVTKIGMAAFSSCSSLITITIPDSVMAIEHLAFSVCTNLTSVTIPDSVTKIGERAFRYCSNLTRVDCISTTPPTASISSWNAFDDNASGRKIYVPAGSVDAYKVADGWKNYAADIVGYDF